MLSGFKWWILALMIISWGLLLVGCAGSNPTPTSIRPTVNLVVSTDTPLPPSPTYTNTPTQVPPSATPSPTATPTASLTPTPSDTPTETSPPPTPSGDDAVHIYLIQTDTGGPVACEDSLVRVNTGLWRTGDIEDDVSKALRSLFVKQEYFGALYNPAYLSNIEVESVDFKVYSGLVDVRLRGTYVRSGDRCDDSRVRAQVWTTIRQFPEVKTVYILLNGNLLGDILATGK